MKKLIALLFMFAISLMVGATTFDAKERPFLDKDIGTSASYDVVNINIQTNPAVSTASINFVAYETNASYMAYTYSQVTTCYHPISLSTGGDERCRDVCDYSGSNYLFNTIRYISYNIGNLAHLNCTIRKL